jgi:hypothetical protein
MGRFARNQSISSSDRAVRQSFVSARPRFSTDPKLRKRSPQVKSAPLKSRSIERPINAIKPDRPSFRLSSLNRRARKRIRLVALAVMTLIALSVGWILGKAVMGPSQLDTPQPVVSMNSEVPSDDEDKSASKSDLEAKAVDAQNQQPGSQDQDVWQDGAAQNEIARPNRKASYSRRQLASANARKGPGFGIVTKPIKAVFRPLKRANPFRLRIW